MRNTLLALAALFLLSCGKGKNAEPRSTIKYQISTSDTTTRKVTFRTKGKTLDSAFFKGTWDHSFTLDGIAKRGDAYMRHVNPVGPLVQLKVTINDTLVADIQAALPGVYEAGY